MLVFTVVFVYKLLAGGLYFPEVELDLKTPQYVLGEKAIYGNNSFEEYYLVSDDLKNLADSTAALVDKRNIIYVPELKKYRIKDMTFLFESNYLDENEEFAKQFRLSNCSSSYIGKDLILTAGHCVDNKNFKNYLVIFGWRYNSENNPQIYFGEDDVYEIKEIVLRREYYGDVKNEKTFLDTVEDYSILRLDRVPSNKKPLEIDFEANITPSQNVYTIGYPVGLAVKITRPYDAKVFFVGKNAFYTNIDAFGGNSGGPVFDSKTNKIIGILITGYGGEFVYELNSEIHLLVNVDTTTKNRVIWSVKNKAITVSENIAADYLSKIVRKYSANIIPIDSSKFLLKFKKGTSFYNRDFIFLSIVELEGKNVFNKGRFIRFDEEDYGTGVMKLPNQIKELLINGS